MAPQNSQNNIDELIKLATDEASVTELKAAELFIIENKLVAGTYPVLASHIYDLFYKQSINNDKPTFYVCLRRHFTSSKNKYGTFYFLDEASKETIMSHYNKDIKKRLYATKDKRLKKKKY